MSDSETAAAVAPGDLAETRGPAWYVAEAVRIVRLDTTAMQRAGRDRIALVYGAVFATAIMFVRGAIQLSMVRVSDEVPAEAGLFAVAVGTILALIIAVPLQLAWSGISIGIMHGAAKLLFGATGRYLGLLRVLWLGSIVQVFAIVPVVGAIVAGLWTLLITLVAFEEIDGIERLQALVLSVGFVALISVIGLALG